MGFMGSFRAARRVATESFERHESCARVRGASHGHAVPLAALLANVSRRVRAQASAARARVVLASSGSIVEPIGDPKRVEVSLSALLGAVLSVRNDVRATLMTTRCGGRARLALAFDPFETGSPPPRSGEPWEEMEQVLEGLPGASMRVRWSPNGAFALSFELAAHDPIGRRTPGDDDEALARGPLRGVRMLATHEDPVFREWALPWLASRDADVTVAADPDDVWDDAAGADVIVVGDVEARGRFDARRGRSGAHVIVASDASELEAWTHRELGSPPRSGA
jgi:hypothetical protein